VVPGIKTPQPEAIRLLAPSGGVTNTEMHAFTPYAIMVLYLINFSQMCFQLTDIQAGQEFFTFNILGLFIKFFL
jgi:hypothetical protein